MKTLQLNFLPLSNNAGARSGSTLIAPALEALRQVRDPQKAEKDPRQANDARLRAALEECLAARVLVPQKCAELRDLAATKEKAVERDYLLYLADVIPLQVERAATCAEMRLAHLRVLKSKAARQAELARCADGVNGTLHWFKYWAWSQDPRPVAPLAVTPFEPFEFQEGAIAWLDRLVFLERKSGLLDKSRDMGASWVAVDWAVKHWRFYPGFKALFGSRVEDLVDDKKNSDALLEKVRFQLRLLPGWMLPAGFDYRSHTGYMNIVNPELDCLLTGEAPTPDFGRQGRYTVAVLDEHAAWPHGGFPQWTASSQSTPCKISISTPKGKLTKQAKLRFNSEVEALSLNWRRHPWKDERWYKGQTMEMSAAEIAQEIDLDYEGSQAGRLLPMWNENLHVITWSEFADFYGEKARDEQGRPCIPPRWSRGMAHDVGTTQEHPAVILWGTTAAEDSRARLCFSLSGTVSGRRRASGHRGAIDQSGDGSRERMALAGAVAHLARRQRGTAAVRTRLRHPV
ncbi:MAG: hypothetical protein HY011_19030 [Acidobacteria bacterium]|nr:hypothetical protein [Acidobacteriota bacterium]